MAGKLPGFWTTAARFVAPFVGAAFVLGLSVAHVVGTHAPSPRPVADDVAGTTFGNQVDPSPFARPDRP